MKYETHGEYGPLQTGLAESAFLTVWPALAIWHRDLVLVGGLVPRYLCAAPTGSRQQVLPPPATLDVDLGIALAADEEGYGTLLWALKEQEFYPSNKHPSRFEKMIRDVKVPVDFLVEKPPRTTGTVQVVDITADILPGIDRALATAREVQITGLDLHGVQQAVTARVCEVGPFLVLKLRAFLHRKQPKDAFDILYTLQHYDGGSAAAVRAFAEEVRLENPACPDALYALRTHFASEQMLGPVKASHFVLGAIQPGESADVRFLRHQLRQDMVDAATALLRAVER